MLWLHPGCLPGNITNYIHHIKKFHKAWAAVLEKPSASSQVSCCCGLFISIVSILQVAWPKSWLKPNLSALLSMRPMALCLFSKVSYWSRGPSCVYLRPRCEERNWFLHRAWSFKFMWWKETNSCLLRVLLASHHPWGAELNSEDWQERFLSAHSFRDLDLGRQSIMEWRIHFMVLGSKEGDRKRQGPNVLPKDIFLMTQLLPTGLHPLKDPSFPIVPNL